METVEVMVYIIVALVAGSLLVYFYSIMNVKQIDTKEDIQFQYSKEDFLKDIFKFWDNCQRGISDKNFTVYIKSEGNLEKNEILSYLIKANKDDQLKKEDIVFDTVELPKVLSVRCYEGRLIIS